MKLTIYVFSNAVIASLNPFTISQSLLFLIQEIQLEFNFN